MAFCIRCGKGLLLTDNFCPRCGLNLSPAQPAQPPTKDANSGARGLGRNTVVYLAKEGLQGFQIQSGLVLLFAILLPIPVLAFIYYAVQFGTLAIYFTLWIAASGLIYDELRLRGLRRLEGYSPGAPDARTKSWLVTWSSIRMADWNGRTLWFSSIGQAHKLSVTFDQKDAPSVQESLVNSGVRYSWRGPRLPEFLARFTTLAILLFIISQILLISAATLPFFPGEAAVYRSVLNNTTSQIAGTSFLGEFRAIFLNNIQVALGGAIPFLGTIGFSIASYSTGRVIQVIAIDRGVSTVRILADLYVLPHTWVEESAYPIAAVAGMLGVTKWRSVAPNDFSRRRNWGSTKLAVALAGAGLILLVAGLIETTTSYIGALAVALWVPLLGGCYLIAKWYRKLQSEEGRP
jgi:uncharacterized membrane protein SpoIIM required for sporulation